MRQDQRLESLSNSSLNRFQIYFPHVDNIYSHRSTQKYKRKPFVSHYWDCRLKGRPPGTAKSDDPTKKKRKRQARERDLCDVKIKITEYFPGARAMMGADLPVQIPANDHHFVPGQTMPTAQGSQQIGLLRSNDKEPPGQPGSDGARYYTIQRVNGNGANGKGDGTAGAHKHTLEDSDRVKKSSIHRHFLKEEKERRKSLVRVPATKCHFLHNFAGNFSNSKRLRPLHAQEIRGRACGHIVIVPSPYLLSGDNASQSFPFAVFERPIIVNVSTYNLHPHLAQCRTVLTASNRKLTIKRLQD